jgi:hypothetical protein
LTRITGLSATMNVLLRDLLLDKGVTKVVTAETAMRDACGPKSQAPRSLEDKRALLGCFSIISA